MVQLNLFVLSAVVAGVLTFAVATEVQQCPDQSFGKLRVQVSNCTTPPCPLKKGDPVDITILFTPENDVTQLTNNASATLFGRSIALKGINKKDVCGHLENTLGSSESCPVRAGSTYVYSDTFTLPAAYPKVSTTIQWAINGTNALTSELLDGQYANVICFQVPVTLV